MLTKRTQSVQEHLSAQGINSIVITLPNSTRTAEDAAQAIGCKVDQIVKSLIFRTELTGKPILVLASGKNRVNEKIIAQHLSEQVTRASVNFTKEVTGFPIGGIPPFGHPRKIDTYIDQDLLQYEKIWAGGGSPQSVFELPSSLLEPLTEGKVISIIAETD